MSKLTIGRLAKAAGVGIETVRFYQRKGLVQEPPRGMGSIRVYHLEDIERLKFIRAAQALGFNLSEIHELLALEEGGACSAIQKLAQKKLATIRERIAGLQRMQRVLSKLERECAATHGRVKCPIISSLQQV